MRSAPTACPVQQPLAHRCHAFATRSDEESESESEEEQQSRPRRGTRQSATQKRKAAEIEEEEAESSEESEDESEEGTGPAPSHPIDACPLNLVFCAGDDGGGYRHLECPGKSGSAQTGDLGRSRKANDICR